jgi:hypothetical protein
VGLFLTFFTFSTKLFLGFVTYLPKVQKIANKNFCPSDRFIIGHDFLGHALYKGPKFFIHNMDFMGIKRCRILCRFTYLSDKMHLKKVIQEKRISLPHKGPLFTDENLYPGISFLGAFSFIFITMERYVTNLRGTFVLVPISTHPTAHTASGA